MNMNIWDIIIVAGIAVVVWISYRAMKKRKEKGCGCCAACSRGDKCNCGTSKLAKDTPIG